MRRLSGELRKLPIWIDDTSPLHVNRLVARIRMLRRKFGIRLAIIDYLQLVGHSQKTETDGIREVIFKLRDLVKAEPTIHLLVLSQFSKADGFSKKRRRTKSDLYGGGAIHHAAHNILIVTVEDPEKKDDKDLLDVEIKIDKQREGRVGKVTCYFDRDHLRYTYPEPYLPGAQ
jgi:replicative DNA helicase